MKKLFILVGLISFFSTAEKINKDFKIPSSDEAFEFFVIHDNQKVLIDIDMHSKAYLYKDKLNIKDERLKSNKIDLFIEGTEIVLEDQFFGKSTVYFGNIKISFNPKNTNRLEFSYQGCFKDKICYPRIKKNIEIKYKKSLISSVKII